MVQNIALIRNPRPGRSPCGTPGQPHEAPSPPRMNTNGVANRDLGRNQFGDETRTEILDACAAPICLVKDTQWWSAFHRITGVKDRKRDEAARDTAMA